MKANLFVASLILFCLGCAQQKESEQLSQQQKDQIRSEVKVAVDNILEKFEKLDSSVVTQCYLDSPDFIEFSEDGSKADFAASKKGTSDFINSASAIKLTTVQEDFKFMAKDIVICAWSGKEEITLKSGERIVVDPLGCTLIFKNISGEWKAIYLHESGIPVVQKASKK